MQDITITWTITDCAGNAKTSKGAGKHSSPLHFREEWPVAKGMDRGPSLSDTFWWVDEGADTIGTVEWSASASFYHGIQEQDLLGRNGWLKPNPATMAGTLGATTSNPNLTDGSSQIPHKLKIRWRCCCGTKQRTKIEEKQLGQVTSVPRSQ
jgi:hypothetical protein